MIILGIETSCDETSAAVLKSDRAGLKLLSNVVSSQIDIHKKYGGVVPEVAAREHVKNIIPVISRALADAKVKLVKIDLMAVATGPGLVTSLIIGVETAKALSLAWGKPLLAVNHMYSHIAANFYNHKIKFPAVCLVVSGGHTEIVYLKNYWQYKKIGQTVDDAAGEAFDKVAKLLGLGYPGGPVISAKAEEFPPTPSALRASPPRAGGERILLPRPMMKSNDFNFSFSGLKTAVLYTAKKMTPKELKVRTPEICSEFQQAVIDVLVAKTLRAARELKAKTVFLAGGVAANKQLRQTLGQKAEHSGFDFLVPEFKLCTDNAAMTAIAGYYLSQKAKIKLDNYKKVIADPNWELF